MTNEEIKDFLARQGFSPNEYGNFIITDSADTQFNLVYVLDDFFQEA